MRKIQFIVFVAILLFHSACVETPEYNTQRTNPYEIEMNDGEKWRIDPEMAISLQRMDAMLKAHASRSKTIDPNLGDRLMEEINELTSACSMTGKAHDELHKWLIPFIELTADLQRATTNKERMKKVEALQVAMEVYHNYFE